MITNHLPALNRHFFPQTLTTLTVCVHAHVTKCAPGGRFCYPMRRRLFFRQCSCDRMLVEWSSNQITSLQTSVPHLKICAVGMPWWGWWLVLPCVCVCLLSRCSRVRLVVTPWTVAHQAPLSMGFSRQEYWSGLPCPPPGDLPAPGIEPVPPASPAVQANSLLLSPWGRPS